MKALWYDYAGNEIHDGDVIIHPSGEDGVVVIVDPSLVRCEGAHDELEWIGVDNPPDVGVFVIACEEDGEVYRLKCSKGYDGNIYWGDAKGYYYHCVKYWMPYSNPNAEVRGCPISKLERGE